METNIIGKKLLSNTNDNFEIIEYFNSYNITIKFDDGTIVKNINLGNARNGKVKNPNKKTIFNIGYIGQGKFTKTNNLKCYSTWFSMLKRCYDTASDIRLQAYTDCLVDEKWYNFQVFSEWFEKNYIDGFALDKDILIKGNKVYGPDTCCFVPQEINNLFLSKRKNSNNLPIGVTLKNNNYHAQINIYNKTKHLGTFLSIDEAEIVFKKEKIKYIREIAEIWKYKIPEKVYLVLINFEL